MVKQNKYRIFIALGLAVVLIIVLISACDAIGIGGGTEPPRKDPTESGILAPANGTQVVAGSKVQVQSAHKGNFSRVELHVQAAGQEQPTLLRADAPDNGVVLQEWMPDSIGMYTVKVVAVDADNNVTESEPIQVEVINSTAVSVVSIEEEQAMGEPADQAGGFQAPTATPETIGPVPTEIIATPIAPEDDESVPVSDADISIAAATPVTVSPNAVPTDIPRFPPPPPAPGIPPGPTQEQLPDMRPPVANAADLLSVYTSDNTQRVLISEPDEVAAKVVGGTTVFRAWRVRNTGTATWGTGYELAFYGGRAMGSGGVAFESTFPGEPARRNTIVNSNRLIVPEGKPNQVAVVEVLLNTPVTPGIHQSYWRMRSPHGVFFGPIMGVTMEVVRECEFNVYGAPVINRFEILGVGNVYQPENPVTVSAEFGDNVTLDWSIINAENFDIVITKPTGEAETISTSDQNGRVTFPVNQLGDYNVTLYADNGSCTVSAEVVISVFPPEDQQFRLIIIHSGGTASTSSTGSSISSNSVPPTDIVAEWEHYDTDANEFDLVAALYQEKEVDNCLFEWEYACYTSRDWVQVGQPVSLTVGTDAVGAVTVNNLVRNLCSQLNVPSGGPIPNNEIHYMMQAKKGSVPAQPPLSNGGVPVIIQRQCDDLLLLPPTELSP